jgi:hypothetical protein
MRRWVCNLILQLLLDLAMSHLRVSQLGGPSPHIYFPQEQGSPVTSLGTGFPFVASYDLQGYGGGILTRLHMGYGKNSSQNQSYITNNSQSASPSWCKAPIWDPRPNFFPLLSLIICIQLRV